MNAHSTACWSGDDEEMMILAEKAQLLFMQSWQKE